jgi:CheY-like chemotaxis protein
VLVIEDDALVHVTVVQELRLAGYDVLATGTAEDALGYLQAGHCIDVLFTDIQLAGQLNGWDAAHRFRDADPGLAVIYASGNAADRSRRVPDSLFFNKPYRLTDVVAACRRLTSEL